MIVYKKYIGMFDTSLNGNLVIKGTTILQGATTVNNDCSFNSPYTTRILGNIYVSPINTPWLSYTDLSTNIATYRTTLNPNTGLVVGLNQVNINSQTVDLYCNGGPSLNTNNISGLSISSFSQNQGLITLFYITNSNCFFNLTGNVGIGIQTPTQKLDVNGNVNVRGNLTVTTSIILTTVGGNVNFSNAGNIDLQGGNAVATTVPIADNSLKIATTAFVKNVIFGNVLYGLTISGDIVNNYYPGPIKFINRIQSTDSSNNIYAGDVSYNSTGAFKSEGSLILGGSSFINTVNYPYQWRFTVGGYPAYAGYSTSGFDEYNAKRLRIIDVSGTIERMTVDQYGNVGIGTKSPIFTLDICGNTRVMETTPSTSTSTGALMVSGGIGLGGNIFVGGNINIFSTATSTTTNSGALIVTGGVGIGGNTFIAGNVNITNAAPTTALNTGAIIVTGGASIGGNTFIGGSLNVTSGTVASSTNTGAFIVSGGAGIGGSIFVGGNSSLTGNSTIGGNLFIQSGMDSSSIGSGALIITGGVGIAKNVFIGNSLNVQAGTVSTSTSTGAVIVTGGVGIGGNINIGLGANITGNLLNTSISFLSKISEQITNTTVLTGTSITVDYNALSVIFYITNSGTISGNFVCNIINVPSVTNKTYTLSLIIPVKFCATSVTVSNTGVIGPSYTLNCNGGFSNVALSNGNVVLQQLGIIYAASSVTPTFVITTIGAYN